MNQGEHIFIDRRAIFISFSMNRLCICFLQYLSGCWPFFFFFYWTGGWGRSLFGKLVFCLEYKLQVPPPSFFCCCYYFLRIVNADGRDSLERGGPWHRGRWGSIGVHSGLGRLGSTSVIVTGRGKGGGRWCRGLVATSWGSEPRWVHPGIGLC